MGDGLLLTDVILAIVSAVVTKLMMASVRGKMSENIIVLLAPYSRLFVS